MNSSVITFPGSNCDSDMDVALNKFGFKKSTWYACVLIVSGSILLAEYGIMFGVKFVSNNLKSDVL